MGIIYTHPWLNMILRLENDDANDDGVFLVVVLLGRYDYLTTNIPKNYQPKIK